MEKRVAARIQAIEFGSTRKRNKRNSSLWGNVLGEEFNRQIISQYCVTKFAYDINNLFMSCDFLNSLVINYFQQNDASNIFT